MVMSGSTRSNDLSQEYLKEYSGGTLLAVAGVLITLETVVVILRFFARSLTTSRFGLDDALIPFAWFTNIGLCTAGIGKSLHFFYRHLFNRQVLKLISFA